jgi:DNA-binding response OmpR family regulator
MTRVLVVDDAADLRLLIRGVLSHSGMEVAEAASGAEALRYLEDGDRPDVVILDVQMPDMDGWETLRAIRRMDSGVAVILCTVKASPVDAVRGWDLGCDAYVRKPFDIHELTATTTMLARLQDAVRVERRHREQAWASRAAADANLTEERCTSER